MMARDTYSLTGSEVDATRWGRHVDRETSAMVRAPILCSVNIVNASDELACESILCVLAHSCDYVFVMYVCYPWVSMAYVYSHLFG
jgi:hypothetical protein